MADQEADIHCNVIQCRRPLSIESCGCVTSCSHIFCMDCANRSFGQALVCPACQTSLTQSGDIVVTQLNPSEEYKSSVLAGLRPDVIMDIACRAIAFYDYQLSQEICYRGMVQQNLESRCTGLQDQLRDVVRDTNRSLKTEKQKYSTLVREQEQEKRRNHDLQMQLQEKTRQFQKLQTIYEKLKRKTVAPNIRQSFQHQNDPPPTVAPTVTDIPPSYPVRPPFPLYSRTPTPAFHPHAVPVPRADEQQPTEPRELYTRPRFPPPQQQQMRPPPPPPPPTTQPLIPMGPAAYNDRRGYPPGVAKIQMDGGRMPRVRPLGENIHQHMYATVASPRAPTVAAPVPRRGPPTPLSEAHHRPRPFTSHSAAYR